jgi:hypothetical protein
MMAFNGDGSRIGTFLREVKQYEIADVIEALMTEGQSVAKLRALGTTADTQAILRRIAWLLVRPGQILVKEELKTTLQVQTAAKAAEALARRRAHWSAQRDVA